jgi:hypothetical protein
MNAPANNLKQLGYTIDSSTSTRFPGAYVSNVANLSGGSYGDALPVWMTAGILLRGTGAVKKNFRTIRTKKWIKNFCADCFASCCSTVVPSYF